MTLIFYEIMSIPFKISFDVEIDANWDHFIDAIFLLDIIISFNTAFYYKGVPVIVLFQYIKVYNSKKIAINYLKFWFWIDLFASFPYTDVIELALT